MDSLQTQQRDLIVRCKTGIFLLNHQANNLSNAIKLSSESNISNQIIFSQDGKYVLIQEKQRVFTIDLESNKQLGQLEGQNIQNICLSTANKYALVMDKLAVDNFQLSLVEFPSLVQVSRNEYKRYKKEQWPLIKFSHDDKHMIHIDSGKLNVVEMATMKVVESYNSGVCDYFQVQPGNADSFLLVCYSLQRELSVTKHEGLLVIFSFNRGAKAIFEKPISDASEIDILWSPDGQSMMMTKSSSSDSSGQSYFGQSQVFLYDYKKRDFVALPTYEGSIHSIKWAADSQSFAIVSGFMPSGTVLFTKEGKPKFEFGKDHKNSLYWGALKRFILICGFGNLDGSIDVWDTVQLKSVGKCKAKSSSLCAWAPCGRKFVTAVITPRMNVDNAYMVFDYQGVLLVTHSFADQELYEVVFRPQPVGTYQDRPPSPSRNKQQGQEKKKLFVPPGGSGALAEHLRSQKQSEGARTLDANETFGNTSQSSWGLQRVAPPQQQQNFPPGYVPTEKVEKKKRIRNKKDVDQT